LAYDSTDPDLSAVLAHWPRTQAGKLDLRRTPFRLLAITDRFDLQGPADAEGAPTNAGEGHIVFGLVDPNGCANRSATVIFEYELVARSQADVASWVAAWHALGSSSLGSEAYNSALQAITERFASGSGSRLARLRTNALISNGGYVDGA